MDQTTESIASADDPKPSLPHAQARQRVEIDYSMIDAIDTNARPLKVDLQRFGQRQPSCRAIVLLRTIATESSRYRPPCRTLRRCRPACRHPR